MEKLIKDKAAVNEVKAIVSREEEKMRSETELVSKYAMEAERDLADVNPLLDAAKESLNALEKADISEIRFKLIFSINFYVKLNNENLIKSL
jgi:hypothetical protein